MGIAFWDELEGMVRSMVLLLPELLGLPIRKWKLVTSCLVVVKRVGFLHCDCFPQWGLRGSAIPITKGVVGSINKVN